MAEKEQQIDTRLKKNSPIVNPVHLQSTERVMWDKTQKNKNFKIIKICVWSWIIVKIVNYFC